MHCDRHDDRPDQEPTSKDEGKRREHPGQRHARLEQIDGKKGATPAKRDGVDAVMQVEEINRPVAEEGHAACPDSIYVFRVFLMVPSRADNLMHGRTMRPVYPYKRTDPVVWSNMNRSLATMAARKL